MQAKAKDTIKQRESEIVRLKEQLPNYIAKQIQLVAEKGQNTYMYRNGERRVYDKVFCHLKSVFSDFKVELVNYSDYKIINYDRGIDEEFTGYGIKFSW